MDFRLAGDFVYRSRAGVQRDVDVLKAVMSRISTPSTLTISLALHPSLGTVHTRQLSFMESVSGT